MLTTQSDRPALSGPEATLRWRDTLRWRGTVRGRRERSSLSMAWLVLLLCVTLIGCQRQRRNQELLERELRLQEDRIHELQYHLEQAEHELLSRRGEIPSVISPPMGLPAPGSTAPSPFPGPPVEGPRIELPPGLAPPGESIPARPIAPPSPPGERTSSAAREVRGAGPAPWTPNLIPNLTPAAPGLRSPTAPPEVEAPPLPIFPYLPEPELSRIEAPRFSVNPPTGGAANIATGGPTAATRLHTVSQAKVAAVTMRAWPRVETNGQAAWEVVVEPRTSQGEILPTPGEISIVAVDPAVTGPAARIARWDFSTADVADWFQDAAPGEGVKLKLAWPATEAPPPAVQMHVRMITAAGQEFRAAQALSLAGTNLPGPEASELPGAESAGSAPPFVAPPFVAPPEREASASPAAPQATPFSPLTPPGPRVYPPPVVRLPQWSPYR